MTKVCIFLFQVEFEPLYWVWYRLAYKFLIQLNEAILQLLNIESLWTDKAFAAQIDTLDRKHIDILNIITHRWNIICRCVDTVREVGTNTCEHILLHSWPEFKHAFSWEIGGLVYTALEEYTLFYWQGKGFCTEERFLPWESQNTKRVGTSLRTEQAGAKFSKNWVIIILKPHIWK